VKFQTKSKPMNNGHSFLKGANMFALYLIAFWVLPIGQITLIALAGCVESIGIALFYSDLFVSKLNMYLAKVGWSAGIGLGAGISFAIGLLLAAMQSIGVFVFRLIGSKNWATSFSVAFWAVATFAYYAMLSANRPVTATLILGIALMNGISSTLISVCSNNLAAELAKMPFFKDLVAAMYKKPTIAVGKDGKLVFEEV
jgi:hypothetical protein